MNSINQTSVKLQSFTHLPVQEIQRVDGTGISAKVKTPHRGDVIIEYKEIHYPFLFGSVTETDKSSQEIISNLMNLEVEAKSYLLQEWKKSIK